MIMGLWILFVTSCLTASQPQTLREYYALKVEAQREITQVIYNVRHNPSRGDLKVMNLILALTDYKPTTDKKVSRKRRKSSGW